MECPGCHRKIGFFSKAANRFGKKTCPQCGKALKLKINWKKYLLIFLPLMIIANLVLVGIARSLAVGIVAGFAVVLSMKVVEVQESDKPSEDVHPTTNASVANKDR